MYKIILESTDRTTLFFLKTENMLVCVCICSCLGEEYDFLNINGTNNRFENLHGKKLHKALAPEFNNEYN